MDSPVDQRWPNLEGCSEEQKSRCIYRTYLRSHRNHPDVTQKALLSHLRSVPREPGFQAELGLTLAKSRQLRSPAEPPTIFIDLRPSEPSDPRSVERYWEW